MQAPTDSMATSIDLGPSYSTGAQFPYRISSHRKNWALWCFFFIFDGCIFPIILFYALWHHTSLSHTAIFALITSLSFWTSYHKWFSRGWRLIIRKDGKYRPINGHRWGADFSYHMLSLALGVMIILLIIGTAANNPLVRVVSMAPVSVLYSIAVYMFTQNALHCLGVRAPFPISSIQRGQRIPPPMYTIVEDMFAVDGSHEGLRARQATLALYNGSATFRSTMMWWSWVWAFACGAVAVVLTILVAVTSKMAGFGIGEFSSPLV